MNILAIETSCDETAAAIVTDKLEILSSVVASQDKLHQRFGGVVPEIASRAHLERILPVIEEALQTRQTRPPGSRRGGRGQHARSGRFAFSWSFRRQGRRPCIGSAANRRQPFAGTYLRLPFGRRAGGVPLCGNDRQRRPYQFVLLCGAARFRADGRDNRRRRGRGFRQGG